MKKCSTTVVIGQVNGALRLVLVLCLAVPGVRHGGQLLQAA